GCGLNDVAEVHRGPGSKVDVDPLAARAHLPAVGEAVIHLGPSERAPIAGGTPAAVVALADHEPARAAHVHAHAAPARAAHVPGIYDAAASARGPHERRRRGRAPLEDARAEHARGHG